MKGGRLTGRRLAFQIIVLGLGLVTAAPAAPKLDPRDPLVHYTPGDLAFLAAAGRIINEALQGTVQPIKNIGFLNERYQPWGEERLPDAEPSKYSVTLKDPLGMRSDHWTFSGSEPLSLKMLAHVHRGTPWQSIYLKSPDVDPLTWQYWTGNSDSRNATLTMPTNDWRLMALLASLLNTNNPRQLLSINDRNTNAWVIAQDGLVVLSNSLTDAELNFPNAVPQFDTIIVSSNSPQAAAIADAIARSRANQPGHYFRGLGDILAVPELSTNSPWLNRSSAIQLQRGISDEAYEKIPVQLLARLRPDSVGSLLQTGGSPHIQFTGFDDYPYAVEVSSNLVDWTAISTNYPTNGVFEITEPPAASNARRFYRSVLLP